MCVSTNVFIILNMDFYNSPKIMIRVISEIRVQYR